MIYDAVLTAEANEAAANHLLQHLQRDIWQEDLCFALWRPSTGADRTTALIDKIILPSKEERLLHGNASITPDYLARAVTTAYQNKAGLAFMHSHPYNGWQPLSWADEKAEKDAILLPTGATGLPLVGLTIGKDGYWSARFWHKGQSEPAWCEKVRIIGPKTYGLQFNDHIRKPILRREILKRTYDTWGAETQNNIARMHIGIVGLGSVGCIIAEAIARIGVERLTLIDHDRVELHNLDRLLYGTEREIGNFKAEVAKARVTDHATASQPRIEALPISLKSSNAYSKALDCDLIFSSVDRPVARDILNHIANGHMIPVIDCGIAANPLNRHNRFDNAHWRAHIISPYHQCMRCNGQYSTGLVSVELDGSLDNPSYIRNLPEQERNRNQNVFPFSLGAASMAVNLMLRYVLSPDWWPEVKQQDYQMNTGEMTTINHKCHDSCPFPERKAGGDPVKPGYLTT